VPASAITGLNYYTQKGLPSTATPPATPPIWLGVQNAAGQYVVPTPASIDAGVNAGGGTPLFALSHPVSGPVAAYPLVYVNHLYAPAHGLSAAKTEALATVIRYLATAGQDAAAAQNDGRLSQSLSAQALAAANQLVASNCTAAGEQVIVSTDMGPYAPTLASLGGKTAAQRQAELQAIGPMLHCVGGSSSTAPSTTVPQTTSPGSTVPPGSNASSPGGALGQVQASMGTPTIRAATGPGSTSSGLATGKAPSLASPGSTPAGSTSGPITLANLPLPLPWSAANGYDRLAGLALGGAGFLLIWRSRRAIARLVRP
jgi:hypothetical protein